MSLTLSMGIALGVYLAAMFALALRVHGKVQDAEDFLVAGRRLSLPFATATLFGTWFGAGTLLASADEVRTTGLRAVAVEPLGAGLCLVLAGLFFARPLWEAKLLTLADFYRNRARPRRPDEGDPPCSMTARPSPRSSSSSTTTSRATTA